MDSGVNVLITVRCGQNAADVFKAEGMTIIDCPPGSACSVMESVMDADYCLLVAEPTAFGFHNFRMVHELVTLLEKSAVWSSTSRKSPTNRWNSFVKKSTCQF